MADSLIHIRVGKEIKKGMSSLIEKGLFTNQTEIAREAIRDLMLKYSSYSEAQKSSQNRSKKRNEAKGEK